MTKFVISKTTTTQIAQASSLHFGRNKSSDFLSQNLEAGFNIPESLERSLVDASSSLVENDDDHKEKKNDGNKNNNEGSKCALLLQHKESSHMLALFQSKILPTSCKSLGVSFSCRRLDARFGNDSDSIFSTHWFLVHSMHSGWWEMCQLVGQSLTF